MKGFAIFALIAAAVAGAYFFVFKKSAAKFEGARKAKATAAAGSMKATVNPNVNVEARVLPGTTDRASSMAAGAAKGNRAVRGKGMTVGGFFALMDKVQGVESQDKVRQAMGRSAFDTTPRAPLQNTKPIMALAYSYREATSTVQPMTSVEKQDIHKQTGLDNSYQNALIRSRGDV